MFKKKTFAYKPHIDGLRALAVLAVILYHIPLDIIPSGYLGVDVFFVISGYVITNSIIKLGQLPSISFFTTFFYRRVKRLFPSLLFLVVISFFIMFFISNNTDTQFKTGLSSLYGMSNQFLYVLAFDYWAIDAKNNIFTHTWSLSVEEQFYLIIIIVWIIFIRFEAKGNFLNVKTILAASCFASFFIWLYNGVNENVLASHYLLQSRFWEIGIGCLAALGSINLDYIPYKLKNFFSINKCLFLLVIIFFIDEKPPLILTPLTILFTVLIISKVEAKKNNFLSHSFLLSIGKCSYSLYLWHWPIIIWANYFFDFSFLNTLLVLCAIFAAGYSTYFFIEKPIRQNENITKKLTLLTIFTILPLITFTGIILNKKLPSQINAYFGISKINYNIKLIYESDCSFNKKTKKLNDINSLNCLTIKSETEDKPKVYLIGDSHSAQWAPLFIKKGYITFFLGNRGADKFPDKLYGNQEENYYEKINLNNFNNLKKLLGAINKGDLVVYSSHRGYFNPVRDKHLPKEFYNNTKKFQIETFSNILEEFFIKVKQKGAYPVIILDVPLLNNNSLAFCLKSEIIFGFNRCMVSKSIDDLNINNQNKALLMVQKKLEQKKIDVMVFDPKEFMIDKDKNYKPFKKNTENNYQFIMRDHHHVTVDFAESLVTKFPWNLVSNQK